MKRNKRRNPDDSSFRTWLADPSNTATLARYISELQRGRWRLSASQYLDILLQSTDKQLDMLSIGLIAVLPELDSFKSLPKFSFREASLLVNSLSGRKLSMENVSFLAVLLEQPLGGFGNVEMAFVQNGLIDRNDGILSYETFVTSEHSDFFGSFIGIARVIFSQLRPGLGENFDNLPQFFAMSMPLFEKLSVIMSKTKNETILSSCLLIPKAISRIAKTISVSCFINASFDDEETMSRMDILNFLMEDLFSQGLNVYEYDADGSLDKIIEKLIKTTILNVLSSDEIHAIYNRFVEEDGRAVDRYDEVLMDSSVIMTYDNFDNSDILNFKSAIDHFYDSNFAFSVQRNLFGSNGSRRGESFCKSLSDSLEHLFENPDSNIATYSDEEVQAIANIFSEFVRLNSLFSSDPVDKHFRLLIDGKPKALIADKEKGEIRSIEKCDLMMIVRHGYSSQRIYEAMAVLEDGDLVRILFNHEMKSFSYLEESSIDYYMDSIYEDIKDDLKERLEEEEIYEDDDDYEDRIDDIRNELIYKREEDYGMIDYLEDSFRYDRYVSAVNCTYKKFLRIWSILDGCKSVDCETKIIDTDVPKIGFVNSIFFSVDLFNFCVSEDFSNAGSATARDVRSLNCCVTISKDEFDRMIGVR